MKTLALLAAFLAAPCLAYQASDGQEILSKDDAVVLRLDGERLVVSFVGEKGELQTRVSRGGSLAHEYTKDEVEVLEKSLAMGKLLALDYTREYEKSMFFNVRVVEAPKTKAKSKRRAAAEEAFQEKLTTAAEHGVEFDGLRR